MPVTVFRRLGYVGAAKQASQGTGVAPTKFWKLVKHALVPSQKIGYYRDGNVRDLTFGLKELINFAGAIQTYLYADEGAALLAWALGLDTISGVADPYTHTLSFVDSLPWLSVEVGYYMDSGGVIQLTDRVIDTKVGKLTVDAEATKPALLTADFVGMTSAKQVAPATVTFNDTPATQGPSTFLQGVFTITGPTDAATLQLQVQKAKIEVDQKLLPVPGPNSVVPIALLEQARQVNLTFDAAFSGPSIYQLAYYGAAAGTAPAAALGSGTLDLKFTAAAAPEHSQDFNLAALDFTIVKLEINPDAGLAMASVTAQPRRSGATYPLAVICKNAFATSYTA